MLSFDGIVTNCRQCSILLLTYSPDAGCVWCPWKSRNTGFSRPVVGSFPMAVLPWAGVAGNTEEWGRRFTLWRQGDIFRCARDGQNITIEIAQEKMRTFFKVSKLLSSLFPHKPSRTKGNQEDFIGLQFSFRSRTSCCFKSVL